MTPTTYNRRLPGIRQAPLYKIRGLRNFTDDGGIVEGAIPFAALLHSQIYMLFSLHVLRGIIIMVSLSSVKDCSGCLYPHRRESYEEIVRRYGEIAEAMPDK